MRPARQTGKETSCTSRRRGRRHHTGRSGARPSPSAARSQSKGRSRDVNKATRENCARTRTTRTSHKTNERTKERTNEPRGRRAKPKQVPPLPPGWLVHVCMHAAFAPRTTPFVTTLRSPPSPTRSRSLAERNCLSQITILRSVGRSTVDGRLIQRAKLERGRPNVSLQPRDLRTGREGGKAERNRYSATDPLPAMPAVPAVPEL